MTRIKLCGLTREQDIEAANRTRPDLIGFVFELFIDRIQQFFRPRNKPRGIFHLIGIIRLYWPVFCTVLRPL